jgi:hypothetical protein
VKYAVDDMARRYLNMEIKYGKVKEEKKQEERRNYRVSVSSRKKEGQLCLLTEGIPYDTVRSLMRWIRGTLWSLLSLAVKSAVEKCIRNITREYMVRFIGLIESAIFSTSVSRETGKEKATTLANILFWNVRD